MKYRSKKTTYLLTLLFVLCNSFSFGQTTKLTRGEPLKNQFYLSCIDGTEIKKKYCFFLSKNEALADFYFDIFNNKLELEKSIPFSKPKGYYYLTGKFVGNNFYYFVYGKDKVSKKTNVVVFKYDPLSGEVIKSKVVLEIASYKSKVKVRMDNDKTFSIYSTNDDGHLTATCINSNLEIIQKDKIPLPKYIPKHNISDVFHSGDGTLIAFYIPEQTNKGFSGCMITSQKNKVKIEKSNYGAGSQFGLKIIDKSNFYLFISKTEDHVFHQFNFRGIYANTMNTLEIFKYDNLELISTKKINVFKDLTQPLKDQPEYSINEFMGLDKDPGNYKKKINSSILSYDNCTLVNGKLKYLVLKSNEKDNRTYDTYQSNGIIIIDLEENKPKYFPIKAYQSGFKYHVGIQYLTSNDSSLNFVYSPVTIHFPQYYKPKDDSDSPLVCAKIDPETQPNHLVQTNEIGLNLWEDNFYLQVNQNYRTTSGFVYYQIATDRLGGKKLRRIVKLDINE